MVADQPSIIQALNKIKPEFAIIDLSLLGHDDFNTASTVNKLFPDLKIIILSDHNEPGIVDEVMSAGFLGFVLQQYAGIDLFDAIESIKGGQTFLSPAATNRQDSGNKNER